MSTDTKTHIDMKIPTIIEAEPYFLHEVDRWPHNGRYGEGRYIYVFGNHYLIKEFDEFKKYVHTTTGEIVKLGNDEPDYELFLEVMGKPWDDIYKNMWKDNEDYTDYVPLVYRTIEQYITNEGEFYHKERN